MLGWSSSSVQRSFWIDSGQTEILDMKSFSHDSSRNMKQDERNKFLNELENLFNSMSKNWEEKTEAADESGRKESKREKTFLMILQKCKQFILSAQFHMSCRRRAAPSLRVWDTLLSSSFLQHTKNENDETSSTKTREWRESSWDTSAAVPWARQHYHHHEKLIFPVSERNDSNSMRYESEWKSNACGNVSSALLRQRWLTSRHREKERTQSKMSALKLFEQKLLITSHFFFFHTESSSHSCCCVRSLNFCGDNERRSTKMMTDDFLKSFWCFNCFSSSS